MKNKVQKPKLFKVWVGSSLSSFSNIISEMDKPLTGLTYLKLAL